MTVLQVFGLFIHFSTGTEAQGEIHWANLQTSTAQYSGMSATLMSVGFYCRMSTPSIRATFHFSLFALALKFGNFDIFPSYFSILKTRQHNFVS